MSSSPRSGTHRGSRRDRLRDELRADIKAAALRQLTEGGLPALSLRGISRELGLSVGGLYRHYANTADLLADLCADAYAGLGEAVIRACARVPADEHRRTWLCFCRAYHRWARAHRVEYGLLYGDHPAAHRMSAQARIDAARDFRTLGFRIIVDAAAAGALDPARAAVTIPVKPTANLAAALEAVHIPADPALIALTLSGWAALHGIVTLDLAGVLNQFAANPDQLVEAHLAALTHDLGFLDTAR